MRWYSHLALKHLFPKGKRVPFFTVISIVGVMLGVMVLVVVQTVMNGFAAEIHSTIKNTSGDIRIEGEDLIRKPELLKELLEQNRFVDIAAPYAYGMVMAQHNNIPGFPQIRGIDLSIPKPVIPIEEYLIAGTLDDLDDDSIFISSGLAQSLGVSIGSVIEIYTPLMLYRMKEEEILLPREMEVVGIFETGWGQVDSNTILSSLRFMQEIYGLGDSVHGISIRLKPNSNINKATQSINELLPVDLYAYDWMLSNKDLIFILQLEKTVMFFIILFIILVSSFSIASSLMTSVVRKTKEIGLLGAIGAQPKQIAACFCLQGFFIGLIGTALGILAGLITLNYRNPIVHTFSKWTHSEEAFRLYYEFVEIPAKYLLSDFAIIVALGLLISTCAGIFPAIKAARMKPSDALRNE